MSKKESFYDIYKKTPESERKYYVYMWFEKSGDDWIPFYVGEGSGNRFNNMGSRSQVLREYISSREIKRMIVAPSLPLLLAIKLEESLKSELRRRGYVLIDGEHDVNERKRRQAEGIRKAKERGVRFGRKEKEVDLTLLPGETVGEACNRLGISRNTYYVKLRKLREENRCRA